MSHWKHKIEGVDWASMKLTEREIVFQSIASTQGGGFEQPPFAILWDDPDDMEAPTKVTIPSPTWWAMALHGDILPPVQVYWALKDDEAQPDFKRHTRSHLMHDTPPMQAMTEKEAMEYLVMKDIPRRVWAKEHNRTMFKIVKRDMIPTDRTFRNAWEMAASP